MGIGRVRRALKWAAIIVGPMLAMGWVVGSWFPDDWQPIEASVRSSRIASVRYGTLQWALMVEAAYEVSGRSYATRRDVFRNVDREVVEAEARNWPPGRSFRLYFDAKNPGSTSLVPDGGREATVVTAVLLTPMLVGLAAFVLMLVRRRNGVISVDGRTD